jgi:hypothetical protein
MSTDYILGGMMLAVLIGGIIMWFKMSAESE